MDVDRRPDRSTSFCIRGPLTRLGLPRCMCNLTAMNTSFAPKVGASFPAQVAAPRVSWLVWAWHASAGGSGSRTLGSAEQTTAKLAAASASWIHVEQDGHRLAMGRLLGCCTCLSGRATLALAQRKFR